MAPQCLASRRQCGDRILEGQSRGGVSDPNSLKAGAGETGYIEDENAKIEYPESVKNHHQQTAGVSLLSQRSQGRGDRWRSASCGPRSQREQPQTSDASTAATWSRADWWRPSLVLAETSQA